MSGKVVVTAKFLVTTFMFVEPDEGGRPAAGKAREDP